LSLPYQSCRQRQYQQGSHGEFGSFIRLNHCTALTKVPAQQPHDQIHWLPFTASTGKSALYTRSEDEDERLAPAPAFMPEISGMVYHRHKGQEQIPSESLTSRRAFAGPPPSTKTVAHTIPTRTKYYPFCPDLLFRYWTRQLLRAVGAEQGLEKRQSNFIISKRMLLLGLVPTIHCTRRRITPWHVIQLSNSISVEPLSSNWYPARPDSFTVYPSKVTFCG
jgi:hypothetical protein